MLYHTEALRPTQLGDAHIRALGIGNNVLGTTFMPQTHGAIRCKRQLGGIIKGYYRDAA